MFDGLFENLLAAFAIVSSLFGIHAWLTDKSGKKIYRWLFFILSITLFVIYFSVTSDKKSANDDVKKSDTTNIKPVKDTATTVKTTPDRTSKTIPGPDTAQGTTKPEQNIKPKPAGDMLVIGSNNQLAGILQDIQTVCEKKGYKTNISPLEFTSVDDYKGMFKKLMVVHVELTTDNPISQAPNMISVGYTYSIKYYDAETGRLINEKSKRGAAKAGYKREQIIGNIETDIIDETTSIL